MKAIIESVTLQKEFGTLYLFKIGYDGKTAYYNSKDKEQKKFIKGKEAEFTEEMQRTEKGEFLKIRPVSAGGYSGYNKSIKKEQSRYSGFAVSYVKDLIIAEKIDIKDWEKASEKIFKFMVKLDKSLES